MVKHQWMRDSNGDIDIIQVGEEDYHTGPICTICGFSFCQDCNEDGWNDDSCPGPEDKSANGGFFVQEDFKPVEEKGNLKSGHIEKIDILK